MKYPEVRFNSKAFSKEMPEEPDSDPWFAGEDLAKALISDLAKSEHVSIDPEKALVEEDWGWCICLKIGKEPFFLGVGEDWDSERDWKVFIAKDLDFVARLFRKAALQQSIEQLRTVLDEILRGRRDVTEVAWATE